MGTLARKRDVLKKYDKIINFIIKLSKYVPTNFYLFLLKVMMPFKSNLAIFIRYICLKNCAKSCGDNVAIFSNVYLLNIENLEIGNNVSVHPMCYINAGGSIKIGDDVSIAHGSSILSEEHIYSDIKINIKDQGVEYKETIIENNVWIGSGTRILGGTYIKSGSIVAAGAVVKNIIENDVVVGGVPAKILKERI